MITPFMAPDTLRDFERFNQRMEDLFRPMNERLTWLPSVDIKETPQDLTFFVEIPGVNKADLDVKVVGDILTIHGRRDFKAEERKEDFVRLERGYGDFVRTFSLNIPVKPEKVTATYKEGILAVRVPKAEGVKAHKVRVDKG